MASSDTKPVTKDPKEVAAAVFAIFPRRIRKTGLFAIDSIKTAAKSVCKIIRADGSTGCGFFCKLPVAAEKQRLVGLMTNNHVIGPDCADETFEVRFENCAPIHLSMKDDVAWSFSDAKFDITFMQLLPDMVSKLLGEKVPVKALEFSPRNVIEHQEIAIVQFPRGGAQKTAFANVKEIIVSDFKHSVPTDYGSSGSPIFEIDSWAVVGIHKTRGSESSPERCNWAVEANVVVDAIINDWRRSIVKIEGRRRHRTISRKEDVGQAIEGYYAPKIHKAATSGNLQGIKDALVNFREEFRPRDGAELVLEELLIDHRDHTNHNRTALIEAACEGSWKVVSFLVQNCDADVYAQDTAYFESTAIHLAAEFGHFEVVDFLLQMEPDLLDYGNKYGDTALSMAAFGGHLDIVEYLVRKKKANANLKGELGRTALMRAVVNGHLPVVKVLVEKGGANLEQKDETGHKNTALHLAAYFGHAHIVAYLLSVRPSLAKVKNGLGRLASYYANLPLDKSEIAALLSKKE